MSLLNWIALVLSLVLWVVQQYIGHGVGMASSAPTKKGSPQDIYLNRVEIVRGIVGYGALLIFISQLIPIPLVKTIGLIILAISLLSLAALRFGLLRYRLPKPEVTQADE